VIPAPIRANWITPIPAAWIVHSRNGVTALAWPIDPINSEAAPDATGAAPDPTKEIHHG
jgi:hypothetical protein